MDRQLVAVLDRAADLVNVGKIQPRINALAVKIQRDVGQVEIAGPFTVTEQAAFQPVGAGHYSKLSGRGARTAVVVRMHRQDDRVSSRQIAMHPLDHVGKNVGCGMLDGGWQVDDAFALGRRQPDSGDRVNHPFGEREFGA